MNGCKISPSEKTVRYRKVTADEVERLKAARALKVKAGTAKAQPARKAKAVPMVEKAFNLQETSFVEENVDTEVELSSSGSSISNTDSASFNGLPLDDTLATSAASAVTDLHNISIGKVASAPVEVQMVQRKAVSIVMRSILLMNLFSF